jgi:hypothetical protein
MYLKRIFPVLLSVLMGFTLLISAAGCGGGTEETPTGTTTTTQPSETVPMTGESDSIITAKLYMILKYDLTGLGANSDELNQWELTVRIQSSTDVPGYTNPTKDWVDKQLIAKTDADMTGFRQGDEVTARVKAVTDDPEYQFYMYDIVKKAR